jgi:hypothetical protein
MTIRPEEAEAKTNADVDVKSEVIAIDEWTEHFPLGLDCPKNLPSRGSKGLYQSEKGQQGSVDDGRDSQPLQSWSGRYIISNCREEKKNGQDIR